jgi:hypothetical protein
VQNLKKKSSGAKGLIIPVLRKAYCTGDYGISYYSILLHAENSLIVVARNNKG